MPPEEKFSREKVAAAAFSLVRRQGMSKLSARNVARKLGSSTAPVYNHFSSMQELKAEVMVRARDLLLEYTTRPYSEMIFRNIGTGYIVFARDEPELFQAMFMEKGAYKDQLGVTLNFFKEEMAKDTRLTPLNEEQRADLLKTMKTFTHGLATQIWAGIMEKSSDEEIIEALTEVGAVIIEAALKEAGSDSDTC